MENLDNLNLIYINHIGVNHLNNYVYEFLFSDTKANIDGDNWDTYPASGQPSPPYQKFIKAIGVVESEDLKLDVIQENSQFAVWDAVDGLIALGWENVDDYETYPENRLIFHFGIKWVDVQDMLYEKDITIKYKAIKNEK